MYFCSLKVLLWRAFFFGVSPLNSKFASANLGVGVKDWEPEWKEHEQERKRTTPIVASVSKIHFNLAEICILFLIFSQYCFTISTRRHSVCPSQLPLPLPFPLSLPPSPPSTAVQSCSCKFFYIKARDNSRCGWVGLGEGGQGGADSFDGTSMGPSGELWLGTAGYGGKCALKETKGGEKGENQRAAAALF